MPRLTDADRAARRLGMGSTDVAEIMGLCPWEDAGPMRVFCQKRGLIPEGEESPEMMWGHTLEPVVMAWYEREIAPVVPVYRRVHHQTEAWLFATLDAYALGSERRNIEAKARNGFMARLEGWDENDPAGIPRHVRVQVNIGMAIREAPETDVVATIGGSPPKVWRIPYDQELAHSAIAEAKRFWHEHVLAGEPPRLDHTSATRDYLDAKYPRETEPTFLKATPELIKIAEKRIGFASLEKTAAKGKAECDARLLAAIGTMSGASGPSPSGLLIADTWKMTWKTSPTDGKRRARFTVRNGKQQQSGATDDDE